MHFLHEAITTLPPLALAATITLLLTITVIKSKTPEQSLGEIIRTFIVYVIYAFLSIIITGLIFYHILLATKTTTNFANSQTAKQNTKTFPSTQFFTRPKFDNQQAETDPVSFQNTCLYTPSLAYDATHAPQRQPIQLKLVYESEQITDQLTVPDLIESYAAVFVGIFAVVGILLQFKDVRDQHKIFRISSHITFWNNESESIRRSIDTYLPLPMKKGTRYSSQQYKELIKNYYSHCSRAGVTLDLNAIHEVEKLIRRLANAEFQIKKYHSQIKPS